MVQPRPWLDSQPIWLPVILVFVVLVGANWVGQWLRLKREKTLDSH
jgi:hypothetical protein